MGRRGLSLIAFLVAMVLANVAASGYVAARLQHAAELGEPWAQVADWRLYSPLAWHTWRQQWGSYARDIFNTAGLILCAGAIAGFGLIRLIRGGKQPPPPTGAYGTSRWATDRELEQAGMFGNAGIVLAQAADAVCKSTRNGLELVRPSILIRHDGPEHAILFAPTGSGKGVGVVLPTLLAWNASAIVYDIKRENWEKTAGWRSLFSHVLRFEPCAEHSVRFNPLWEVRPAPYDVRDAQNIAEILVNPDALTEEQKDHWKLTGQAFLVGVILHVLYAEADKSLGGVLTTLTDPTRDLAALLDAMLNTPHLPTGPHPAVAGAARAMMNRSANERSGVVSTAESFLSLYRDPLVAANTAVSDFTLSDLMCAERPVTLYLVAPPSDADRTKPLMRLLLNFFGRRLTEHLGHIEFTGGRRPKRHRLLYLIDEFPSLGRMPFFEVQLAYLRGYGIKCLLVAQSLHQLERAYGANHSILDNCHIRVTYASNDDKTADRISRLLGQASLVRAQYSEAKREGLRSPQVTVSYQEYGRALKTPDEILSLDAADALVLVGNQRPYLARKVVSHADSRFRSRLGNPATGANAAPDSRRRQRAELPPQPAVPHWLRLSTPHRRSQAPTTAPLVGSARQSPAAHERREQPATPTLPTPPAPVQEEHYDVTRHFNDLVPLDASGREADTDNAHHEHLA